MLRLHYYEELLLVVHFIDVMLRANLADMGQGKDEPNICPGTSKFGLRLIFDVAFAFASVLLKLYITK